MKFRYIIVEEEGISGTNDEAIADEYNEFAAVWDMKTGIEMTSGEVMKEAYPEFQDSERDEEGGEDAA